MDVQAQGPVVPEAPVLEEPYSPPSKSPSVRPAGATVAVKFLPVRLAPFTVTLCEVGVKV